MPLQSHTADNPNRPKPTNVHSVRTASTIRRLRMYRGKVRKTNDGGQRGEFASSVAPDSARIEANRKWFANIKKIDQKKLQNLRKTFNEEHDPHQVLLKPKDIPYSLLFNDEDQVEKNFHITDVESFDNTFGPKAQRLRPTLEVSDMDGLMTKASDKLNNYDADKDSNVIRENDGTSLAVDQPIYQKGQSKRIWGELFKVVDSSDVIIQILDVRDPIGTRSRVIERYLKGPDHRHRHLVLLLNKVDLVPTWVTERWVRYLSRDHITLAFHASITKPFGKGPLIELLREFSNLHPEKSQISVGLIGYPNVGKSSVINTLRGDRVVKVAPIAGETRDWLFVSLMKRIFLIDCPGIVIPSIKEEKEMDDQEKQHLSDKVVLRGAIRIESIQEPSRHIPALLKKANPEALERLYGIKGWKDHHEFIELLARRMGKLLPGDRPDVNNTCKYVLTDWIRGKLPHYVSPPEVFDEDARRKHRTEKLERFEALQKKNLEQLTKRSAVSTNDEADETEEQEISVKDEEENVIEEEEEESEEESEEEVELSHGFDWDEVFDTASSMKKSKNKSEYVDEIDESDEKKRAPILDDEDTAKNEAKDEAEDEEDEEDFDEDFEMSDFDEIEDLEEADEEAANQKQASKPKAKISSRSTRRSKKFKDSFVKDTAKMLLQGQKVSANQIATAKKNKLKGKRGYHEWNKPVDKPKGGWSGEKTGNHYYETADVKGRRRARDKKAQPPVLPFK
eukprot:TRINITY_DN2471_c0_g1_i2.p1 TRINITY_DN2471_c0_g1~~TRINITY_DN2471_c0_g1_i2.p1  ORF type:complete len:744 (+),score=209.64 TRINITY_DN2471_c0_g1_i2:29-2233(+)